MVGWRRYHDVEMVAKFDGLVDVEGHDTSMLGRANLEESPSDLGGRALL